MVSLWFIATAIAALLAGRQWLCIASIFMLMCGIHGPILFHKLQNWRYLKIS